jgi:uracil-DNA glycosylase
MDSGATEPGELAAGWGPAVETFLASPDGMRLRAFLAQRSSAGARIYPPRPWRALQLTALDEVRVVILGQDPYHGAGQAHGLAFSVPAGVRPPPSLRNILSEVDRDLGRASHVASSGSLEPWAKQGVLLLNAVLTVEDGQPAAHAGQGWEILTARLMQTLVADPLPKAFMLWGAYAQRLEIGIAAPHLKLEANHPSPLSARRPPRPFIGCGHFSAANSFLVAHGRGGIDW